MVKGLAYETNHLDSCTHTVYMNSVEKLVTRFRRYFGSTSDTSSFSVIQFVWIHLQFCLQPGNKEDFSESVN